MLNFRNSRLWRIVLYLLKGCDIGGWKKEKYVMDIFFGLELENEVYDLDGFLI